APPLARDLVWNSLSDPIRLQRFTEVGVRTRGADTERRPGSEVRGPGELPAAHDALLPTPGSSEKLLSAANRHLPAEGPAHAAPAIPVRAAAVEPAVGRIPGRRRQPSGGSQVELRSFVDGLAVTIVQAVERPAAAAFAKRYLARVVNRIALEIEHVDSAIEER